jgi:N-acetylated-alpha-linked acidic dipeptidase
MAASRARFSQRKGQAVATALTVAGEQDVVGEVRLDDAWSLIESFSGLVRESGTEQERQAVELMIEKLTAWNVPYTLHEPELLISLPRGASLVVDGVTYAAKTPSMARSTAPEGETGPIVHAPSAYAASVNDLFSGVSGSGDVAGTFVVTEGLPMPGKVSDLEARGALGVIFIAPGERIHEGICTSIWGSPDLTSYGRKPRIPVISVSKPDGEKLIAQISSGSPTATVVAQHEERWRTIPVLVAELKGSVEPERFVLLHGHVDSWHVGIGDNATGDATLLEAARVLGEHRDELARSVRIAWWSGHSHGRYAGSAWYADTFALDIARNCVCHINCDSPGCRDADVFEDVSWMAEVETAAREAIGDFTGLPAEGNAPVRAGDISFNNIGVSTFLMLSSTMTKALREEKGYHAVGGCGGNIEWHTEADTLDIADQERLLRDMRLYIGATFRMANRAVHPLDFRATLDQIEATLGEYESRLARFGSFDELRTAIESARVSLAALYERAVTASTVEEARPINDALLRIGRTLVPVLYASEGRHRQDPALHIELLPDFAQAAAAVETTPAGVVRTELQRASNRLRWALLEVEEEAARAA